jgi:opacity protein-like surface antigen
MKFRCLIIIISILFLHHPTKAQSYDDPIGIRFGIGGGLGIINKSSPFGYGINLNPQIQWNLADALALNLVTGYTRLLTKDTSPTADYDFIPLKMELKLCPIINRAYLLGIVGAGFGIKKDAKTNFTYGAGLGYEFLNGYDLGMKYETYKQSPSSSTYHPKTGQFAISLTYFFKP